MVKIFAPVKKSLWLITTGLLCLRDRFLMLVHHLSCRVFEDGSEQKCHEERSSVQDSRTWVEV